MELLMKYLKQPSTWKGLLGLAAGAGLYLSPEMTSALVAMLVAAAGAYEVYRDEDKEE